MQLYFWERATPMFVGSAVAAIFDFVSEKDWGVQHLLDRSLRAKTHGGVSEGQILYFL